MRRASAGLATGGAVTRAIEQEIAALWSAGTALVWIASRGEGRAEAFCRRAAAIFEAPVAVWTSQRGLDPVALEAREPLEMLDAAAGAPRGSLFVLLDFAGELDDRRVLRRLRDLLPHFAEEG